MTLFNKRISGGPPGPPETLRRLIAFVIGILLLMGFAFLALPALKNLNAVGPAVELLEESGIEAGAFWYANVEKVGEAERQINSLDLIHERPGKSPDASGGR